MKINDILSPKNATKSRLFSARWLLVLQILISGLLLWRIIRKLDLQNLSLQTHEIDSTSILLALSLMPIAIGLRAYRWHLFLKEMNLGVAFKETFAVVWVGQALNAFLPSGTGEVVKGYFLKSSHGLWNQSIYSSVIDKLVGVSAVFFLGVLPFYLLGQINAALLCLALAAFTGFLPLVLPRWSPKFQPVKGFLLLTTFLISIVSWWFTYLVLFLLFKPLVGNSIPLLFYFALAPAITVARLLPISLNGIGVQEIIIIKAMEQLGITPEISFAASLGFTVVMVILPALIGWVVLLGIWFRRRGKVPA